MDNTTKNQTGRSKADLFKSKCKAWTEPENDIYQKALSNPKEAMQESIIVEAIFNSRNTFRYAMSLIEAGHSERKTMNLGSMKDDFLWYAAKRHCEKFINSLHLLEVRFPTTAKEIKALNYA
ncbi:MAG: hypothetical protein KKF12_21970 [Proteobacteria bacterium]|nr:hypothetical protein [Desulfobacula sp.]MBU4133496.1 hypothetical protein [Pseudomonadota bacterium]